MGVLLFPRIRDLYLEGDNANEHGKEIGNNGSAALSGTARDAGEARASPLDVREALVKEKSIRSGNFLYKMFEVLPKYICSCVFRII